MLSVHLSSMPTRDEATEPNATTTSTTIRRFSLKEEKKKTFWEMKRIPLQKDDALTP